MTRTKKLTYPINQIYLLGGFTQNFTRF